MWKAALVQHQIQPWTGTGSGTYIYYGRQFRSPKVQNDPIHVHNDYLELLAEYGIIGAIVCSSFVLFHLFAGLAGVRRIVDDHLRPIRETTGNHLALVIGAWSGIAALLLHSIVDFNLHIPANTLIVGILFGILASPAGRPSPAVVGAPSTPTPVPAHGWLRWVVPAISAGLLALALWRLPGEVLAERARVALRDDHYAEALALAEQGLTWEKQNPNLYSYVGEAKHYLTLQAPDEASGRILHYESAAAYRKALQLFPRDTGLLLKLGQSLDLLGRFSDATDIYARAFQGDPNFGNVYAYYGRHLQMQRRVKSAARYYRTALQLSAEWPIAREGMESIARLQDDPVRKSLLSIYPEPDDDSPAPAGVLPP